MASTCAECDAVVDVDRAGAHVFGLATLHQLLERTDLAGHDYRRNTVHRSDIQRSPHCTSISRAWVSPHARETMPPAPDNCTSSRLRSATTRAASSNDRAPAT